MASQTFAFTGAAQTFVVPAGLTALDVEVHGACGGGFQSWTPRSRGGKVICTIPVTPGETLQINVGGEGGYGPQTAGAVSPGGWNGGGNGGDFQVFGFQAGGGGGASDIRRGGTTLAHRVVVAGGGGGNGDGNDRGGHGGGIDGETRIYIGETTYPAWSGLFAGQGGSQLAGGAGGANDNGAGGAGSLGQGGAGCSPSGPGFETNQPPGGGGGGGYYGGGGGASNRVGFGSDAYPGGGGSGYTTPGATSVTHIVGGGEDSVPGVAGTGHGLIVLTWPDFIAVPTGWAINTVLID